MLNKLLDFYKSHKYVILWTVGYFIATWAIMNFMFDFNILSAHRWWQLAHAHIRGFPGFVFGILILAMVPMYIATTIVIAKTKQPLFTIKIKIPDFIKRAFQQTPMQENTTNIEPVTTPTPEKEEKTNTPAPIPDVVPSELRVAYARARENVGALQKSVFDLGNITQSQTTQATESEPDTSTPGEIPIPTDFDIDDDLNDMMNGVPQFKEINFDDDIDITSDDDIDNQLLNIKDISNSATPVEQYLTSQSIPFTVDNDVVLTDKYAIVTHTDDEFWVADKESWFAAGKTRPSPIESVKKSANEHNVQPVLFLASNNIMDIENLIPQWETDGIRVITDLKDLI